MIGEHYQTPSRADGSRSALRWQVQPAGGYKASVSETLVSKSVVSACSVKFAKSAVHRRIL